MSKLSTAAKASARIDVFAALGRVVVCVPWLIIAAWIVAVAALTVAFPPLTKVAESQTGEPLPPPGNGGNRADGQGFR